MLHVCGVDTPKGSGGGEYRIVTVLQSTCSYRCCVKPIVFQYLVSLTGGDAKCAEWGGGVGCEVCREVVRSKPVR